MQLCSDGLSRRKLPNTGRIKGLYRAVRHHIGRVLVIYRIVGQCTDRVMVIYRVARDPETSKSGHISISRLKEEG